MAELNIDELNINQPYKDRSEPYEQYFDVMAITKRQKRERILLAEELEDIFFEFLIFMELLSRYGRSYEQAQERLELQYKEKMFEYLPLSDSDFVNAYAAAYAVNAVETTAKHLGRKARPIRAGNVMGKILADLDRIIPVEIPTDSLSEAENQAESNQADSWYTSLDRAKFNAENEANTVLNRSDYLNAVEAGYSRKRWLTEHDSRVRPTHQEVEGVTIPIDSVFVVGNSVFGYPRDMTYSPEPNEYISCRCSIQYLR